MSMIERVALAIMDADWRRETDYNELAKAAIEAMREPTRKVLIAGIDCAELIEDTTSDSYATWRIDSASDYPMPVWQAMIDAALVED